MILNITFVNFSTMNKVCNMSFLNWSICAGQRGKSVSLYDHSQDDGMCSEYKGVGRESHAVSFHDAGSFISWVLRKIGVAKVCWEVSWH